MSAVLETDHLCASYGRQEVVHDLSLHVEEGQIYGFLGLNGAGKSTTIRLILNLLQPTHGTVRLFGQNLKAHHREVLPWVGSLVEAPGFYSHLSGAENLQIAAVMRRLPESSVTEALE
ncbi:MAG: ATP-binding cassette domain-containing protein, partial [Methanocella sp.]